MSDVADMPHRCRKVRGRDEKHADAVHIEDFVEIAPSLDVFDERDQQGFVIGAREIVANPVALAAGEQPALAEGRELAAGNDVLRVCAGIHVGYDDGLRPAIQRSVDQALLVAVDPNHRSHAPDVARAGQVAKIGSIDTSVFAFEPNPVEPCRTECIDVVGMGKPPDDERRLSRFELAADAIGA